MPAVLSTFATWATAPLALLVGRQFGASLGYINSAAESLAKDDPVTDISAVRTGSAPVDAFLGAIVPFFRFVVGDSAASAWLDTLAGMITPWLFYASVEGLKPGGRTLHWLYPTMTLGMQVFGVGFITPLVWVPMMLRRPPTGPLPSTPKTTLALALLCAGHAANIYVMANLAAPEPQRAKFIALFQIVPALSWLAWSFTPFIPDDHPLLKQIPAAPANLVSNLHRGLALLSFTGHLRLVSSFVRDPALLRKTFSAFVPSAAASSPGMGTANFLAWDAVGLFLATGYLVAARAGWGTADVAKFAARAAVVGPGAALGWEFAKLEA